MMGESLYMQFANSFLEAEQKEKKSKKRKEKSLYK